MSAKKPGKSGQRKPPVLLEAKPVPPMPAIGRRGAHWRAATRKTWASWFESGRGGRDAAQVAALERLIRLVDQANADPSDLAVAKEVRLQERALGLISPAPAQPAVADPRAHWREERRAERQRSHDEEPVDPDFTGTPEQWRSMTVLQRREFRCEQIFSQWRAEAEPVTNPQ